MSDESNTPQRTRKVASGPHLCGRNNPLCSGMFLHDECYGRPACPRSRFEWTDSVEEK